MATRKRILCDTNILLDIFDVQRAHHSEALALLWYHVDNPQTTELVSPISSFKDAYYVLTRLYRDEAQARSSIRSVMGRLVRPLDLLAAYGDEALDSQEPDFEDALVGVCAQREHVDAIITRDKRAFAHFHVPAMPAADFLRREGFSYEEVPL